MQKVNLELFKTKQKLFTYVTLNVHTKTSPDPPDTKPL